MQTKHIPAFWHYKPWCCSVIRGSWATGSHASSHLLLLLLNTCNFVAWNQTLMRWGPQAEEPFAAAWRPPTQYGGLQQLMSDLPPQWLTNHQERVAPRSVTTPDGLLQTKGLVPVPATTLGDRSDCSSLQQSSTPAQLQTGRLRPHLQSKREQLFKPQPVCRQFVAFFLSPSHKKVKSNRTPATDGRRLMSWRKVLSHAQEKHPLLDKMCFLSLPPFPKLFSPTTSFQALWAGWIVADSQYMSLSRLQQLSQSPLWVLVRGPVAQDT